MINLLSRPARRGSLLTLALTLVLAPAAMAGSGSLSTINGQVTISHDPVGPGTGGVDVTVDAPAANQIRITANNAADDLTTTAPECTKDMVTPPARVLCTTTNRILFLGSDLADTITINGPIGSTLEGGPGNDKLTGGSAVDQILGRAGDDTLRGGGGDGDRIDPGTGADNADGQDGADEIVVGFDDVGGNIPNDGPDVLADSGASGHDKLSFFGHSAGVTVTVANGKADDGSAGGAEGDDVGAGFEEIQGSAHDDVLAGSAADEKVVGNLGNDAIIGGTGKDDMRGEGGKDTLNAVDGVADTNIDCDSATTPAAQQGAGERADFDAVDPKPDRCEDPRQAGGTGTRPGGTAGRAVAVPFKAVSFKFPDYLRKTSRCGKKGYCKAAEIEADLEKRGLHFKARHRSATAADLEKVVGRKVVAGEILRTSHDGKRVRSGPDEVVQITTHQYAPSKTTCNPKKPFFRYQKRLQRITDLLTGMDLYEAQQFLAKSKCKAGQVEFDYRYTRAVNSPKVSSARVANSRFELVVQHPEARLQLTLSAPDVFRGNMPPALLGDEIVIPAGAGVQATDWTVHAATANGIAFQGAKATLRDSKGELFNTRTSDRAGAWDHDVGPAAGKRYEIFVSVADRDGHTLVGWKQIRSVRLDAKQVYMGIDGKLYAHANGKWGVAARLARASAATVADERRNLSAEAARTILAVAKNPSFQGAAKLDPAGGQVLQAINTINAAGGGDAIRNPERYFEILVSKGVTPMVMTGAGPVVPKLSQGVMQQGVSLTSDGRQVFSRPSAMLNIGPGVLALEINNVIFMPGGVYVVIRSGGFTAGLNGSPTTLNAASAGFDLAEVNNGWVAGKAGGPAKLLGADGGTLVAKGGTNLVGADGASLIGADGASLVGADGASLIGADGASILGAGGPGLAAAAAGSVRSLDGARLIGPDGASIARNGGMNLIAGGGGRLISDKGAG